MKIGSASGYVLFDSRSEKKKKTIHTHDPIDGVSTITFSISLRFAGLNVRLNTRLFSRVEICVSKMKNDSNRIQNR